MESHQASPQPIVAYGSWRQVSGYFDGDGNLGVEVAKYVLRLRIRFIDTWLPQIEAVQGFLRRQRLAMAKIGVEKSPGRNDAYRLEISGMSSVLRAARAMNPLCVKKAEDLRIAIDYLEDRITGDQAIARLNQEVTSLRRAGFMRVVNLPFTRSQGTRVRQLKNARKARAAYAVNVPEYIARRIRDDRTSDRMGHYSLARKYGYSESVIRRILGDP